MKRRRLSKEESDLWRRATRDVRPIERAPVPGPPGPKLGETSREAMFPVRAGKPGAEPKARPHAQRKPGPGSVFAAGDPALDRRVRRGRLRPERAIDLHGMTQVAARVALTSFLEKAQADRCRCVLVVTGKGAPRAETALFDARPPRGIIRRRFIEWLDEEPLRSIIARAAPAAPKDGGAGAFYVFLKRKGARL